MGNAVELIADGEGIAVIGEPTDVERFFLDSGLEVAHSKQLDVSRLWKSAGGAGALVGAGADLASNSGRWVKLTSESAKAVREFGLMPSKVSGVSHAMVGKPGDIKQWLQISSAPTALLSGPFALVTLSTLMQQRAMQAQMDEIVDYLQVIDEKVGDILRGQQNAVLSDMIGVDLVIEDALTVRDEVGRVSDVTWSKVQATSQTLARTQAYALRELDAIAENLAKKKDLGDIARATKDAEPKVREWLAVIARTFQLQDGVTVLELDAVLNSSPEDIEPHRRGVIRARQDRTERIGRSTAAILAQMSSTIESANARVLLNPFDAPAAVQSSSTVTLEVVSLRERLGIESNNDVEKAKRWRSAAGEAFERVRVGTVDGATAARRLGDRTAEKAVSAFRAVDVDGDGIPDQSPAAEAAGRAAASVKQTAAHATGAVASLFGRRAKPSSDDAAGQGE